MGVFDPSNSQAVRPPPLPGIACEAPVAGPCSTRSAARHRQPRCREGGTGGSRGRGWHAEAPRPDRRELDPARPRTTRADPALPWAAAPPPGGLDYTGGFSHCLLNLGRAGLDPTQVHGVIRSPQRAISVLAEYEHQIAMPPQTHPVPFGAAGIINFLIVLVQQPCSHPEGRGDQEHFAHLPWPAWVSAWAEHHEVRS